MYRRFLLLGLLIGLAASPLSAQEKGTIVLKYVPSGLLDYYFTYIQFSGEYYLQSDMSVEVEYGFSRNSGQILEEPVMRNVQGQKYRLGWRKYLEGEIFGGVLLMLRDETFELEGDFRRLGNSFRQRIWYGVDQQTYAAYGTVGVAPIIEGRFQFEGMLGLGARYIDRTFSGVPADAEFLTNGSLFAEYMGNTESVWALSLLLSFKVGVAF